MRALKNLVIAMLATTFVGPGTADAGLMELTPFTGDVSSVMGTLDGIGLTMSFNVPTSSGYRFREAGSVFDNTHNGFNSSSFTPASANTDVLSVIRLVGASTATLTVSFDAPIIDPVLHISSMDRTRYDLSPTTTDLTLLSQSNGLQLSAAGILTDDDNADGEGSIRFNGTFTTLTMNLDQFVAASDGMGLQFSGTAAAVPEPTSFAMLGFAACGLVVRRRRRKQAGRVTP